MRRRTVGAFVAAGLAVTAALALVLSPFASSSPDGLERVSSDQGFAEAARDHALADSPVAGYALRGVGDGRLATGLAGLVGVVVTFASGYAVFTLARRSAERDRDHLPSGARPRSARRSPRSRSGR